MTVTRDDLEYEISTLLESIDTDLRSIGAYAEGRYAEDGVVLTDSDLTYLRNELDSIYRTTQAALEGPTDARRRAFRDAGITVHDGGTSA